MFSESISPKRGFMSFGPKCDLRGFSTLTILDIKITLAFKSSFNVKVRLTLTLNLPTTTIVAQPFLMFC
jgi:hypothetical protein